MDYLPDAEADFYDWQMNFLTYAAAHLADLGLVADDIADAQGASHDWMEVYGNLPALETAWRAAVQLKKLKRTALVTELRKLAQRLQKSPAVDDSERAALGITVPDATPTPVGIPTSRPVLLADTSKADRLTLNFADEGTPTKKAKPAGVSACLLQYKKGGTVPLADADWTFLAIDSATPYVWVFDAEDAGLPVWVRACWINTRQQQGPWSGVVSTRVPG